MTNGDVLREAVNSLLAHRLRAVLSMLGIIAGVGTVVAAMAIAAGARRQALDEIGALGIDNVIVRATADGATPRDRPAPILTLDDAGALARRFPSAVVASERRVRDRIEFSDRTLESTVVGVTPEWRLTARFVLGAGRWIDARDGADRTAVIGSWLARALFDDADPIGQRVLAAGEWRTIVGVLRDGTTGGSHATIQTLDPDRALFVPVRSLDVTLGAGDDGDAVDTIVLRHAPGADVMRGAQAMGALLAARHDGDRKAFEIVVPQELLRARLRAQRSSYALLLAVGTLVLVISGVGITNITVASVTARTAEIGMRRAVGARRSSVLLQFAAEAALLSGVGGVAGIPAGVAAALTAAWIAGWPVALSWTSIGLALALALGVGLSAGIYPARLAASLSPIDALRE